RAEAGAIIEAWVVRHDDAFCLTELSSRAGSWRLPRLSAPVGAAVRLRVRARDVMLATSPPERLSALNVFAGVVAEIAEDVGSTAEIRVDCGGEALIARLTRYSVDHLGLAPGVVVYALVKSAALDEEAHGGARAAPAFGSEPAD